jgi:hypothetical protein
MSCLSLASGNVPGGVFCSDLASLTALRDKPKKSNQASQCRSLARSDSAKQMHFPVSFSKHVTTRKEITLANASDSRKDTDRQISAD